MTNLRGACLTKMPAWVTSRSVQNAAIRGCRIAKAFKDTKAGLLKSPEPNVMNPFVPTKTLS